VEEDLKRKFIFSQRSPAKSYRFLFFVGMGCTEFFPSHVLVVGLFGFVGLTVFLVVLGWGKQLFYSWAMLDGWDEDGIVC